MTNTTMLHVRIDEDVKARASEALAEMGLTISAAVKIMLARVAVERALPFDVRIPNAETRAAMAEADEMARAFLSRDDETRDEPEASATK